MNERIQHKIDAYKKMAKSHNNVQGTSTRSILTFNDSLAEVIRSKKDADQFMAELDSVIQRAK